MPPRPRKIPSYCKHKGTGQAVVCIDGKDYYLGKYGTPESYEKYQRLIAESFPPGRLSGETLHLTGQHTIVELVAAYWTFVKSYYVKNGEATSEQVSINLSLRPLIELYGRIDLREFGPLSLEVVRERMIDAGITRNRINQHVGRIRRMFRWGVSKEIVPVQIYQALLSLPGLRAGRSRAKESEPVTPVARERVLATIPFLQPQLQAMVRFQLATGCRPNEVCLIRPCDVDGTSAVWEYIPESHKTEHHDRQRRVFIGPQGQTILAPWLVRDPQAYCFSPRESRDGFNAARRKARKTPITPSSRKRKRKARPKRMPGNRYNTKTYGYAIRRACKKAGVTNWSPNQLRHSQGTLIRKNFGLEASQVVLGHSKADVTQIYAERDFQLARTVMAKIG